MKVYAENAIYDDPWSYCDARYKIAGSGMVSGILLTPPGRVISNFQD